MMSPTMLKVVATLCLVLVVTASEEATNKDVEIVEAKEIDGHPVAEDRSDAAFLDDSNPPDDQMAVESIDRAHGVYVPPPVNLVQGPIPVPVSMAAKPGSLVIPGPPRRRPGPPPHHKRPLPRRPPPPFHKRPYPVRTNYAPPPSLGNLHRKQTRVGPGFHPPPPMPNIGYAPPPPPHGVHAGSSPPLFSLPPQHSSPAQHSIPPPPPPQHGNVDFGEPKNNDLLVKSESGVSSIYTPPQALSHSISQSEVHSSPHAQVQVPHPVASGAVDGYVPPVLPESRKPILNHNDISVAETGLSGSYVPPSGHGGPSIESWPVSAPEMPQVVALDVKCEKNLMKVRIEFDKPFNGIIFSKGHYSNVHCVHLPAGLGRTHATFDISINSCGTSGNTENGLYGYGSQSGSGTFFENTIVIQYDPQVQEVWDGARKLRCTWHDQYEKSVTFRPFSVDMLDVVRADFAGDNVGCWMQIQVGKGPWASEVSGLVKIGQTMTMVLAIKDDDNKFDMLVRNCMAHDGKRAPIQLVDQRGCITRPKLMSRFTKIKDFGASASVLSYAHFQAFKFPDSMEVHFQCTIQICRYQCPEQCTDELGGGGYQGHAREKREVTDASEGSLADKQADIGVNRVIQVVSTRDLTFILDKNGVEEEKEVTKETLISTEYDEHDGLICMSTPGFAALLVVLLGILIVSCLLSAFLCLRLRITPSARPFISASFDNPAFLRKPSCFDYQ